MKAKVFELAYKGEWDDLLALLRAQPDLVNSESELKGYTPLHQAAWHGASLSVALAGSLCVARH
jgi:ankyrin repeat protein